MSTNVISSFFLVFGSRILGISTMCAPLVDYPPFPSAKLKNNCFEAETFFGFSVDRYLHRAARACQSSLACFRGGFAGYAAEGNMRMHFLPAEIPEAVVRRSRPPKAR